MDFLLDSFYSAILLIASWNKEVVDIVSVSLRVSGSSTLLASIMGVPLGFIIAFNRFFGKRMLITLTGFSANGC